MAFKFTEKDVGPSVAVSMRLQKQEADGGSYLRIRFSSLQFLQGKQEDTNETGKSVLIKSVPLQSSNKTEQMKGWDHTHTHTDTKSAVEFNEQVDRFSIGTEVSQRHLCKHLQTCCYNRRVKIVLQQTYCSTRPANNSDFLLVIQAKTSFVQKNARQGLNK